MSLARKAKIKERGETEIVPFNLDYSVGLAV